MPEWNKARLEFRSLRDEAKSQVDRSCEALFSYLGGLDPAAAAGRCFTISFMGRIRLTIPTESQNFRLAIDTLRSRGLER